MKANRLLIALLLLAATGAFAQSAPPPATGTAGDTAETPAPVSSKQLPPPNYSKQTLMRIFVEEDQDDQPPRSPFDVGLVWEAGDYRFRIVPFVAPFYLNATMPGAHVAPSSALTIDPFGLNHTEAAYTSTTIKDPLRDWKFRRMLKKNETEAKKARTQN